VIHNRDARDGGGVLNLPGATAILTSSDVTDNIATHDDGGIANAGSMALISSIVSGNSDGNDGGGIGNASSLTLITSTVSGKKTRSDGGGIANESVISGTVAVATLTSSVVYGNTASASPGSGGGIFNQAGSTVCLNGTVVTGNSPDDSINVVFPPC